MAKQYRLLVRAQMEGALREPGYIFSLPDGVRGPHRTIQGSSHGAIGQGELRDEPLYVEVPEVSGPVEVEYAPSIADRKSGD